jgi:hypothetical protein
MTGRKRSAWLGAALLMLTSGAARAAEASRIEPPSGPVEVGPAVVPTITPAARDLPNWVPDPNPFELEMKPVDDDDFISSTKAAKPKVDPLLRLGLRSAPRLPDGFGAPVHNYAGQSTPSSPPDTIGDVGPNHFVQVVNGAGAASVQVLSKATGAVLKTFFMSSLTTAMPCRFGFCDPGVLYDRVADRWIISELASADGYICVYVSTTPDPTGPWYAYSFLVETAVADYPKYGVWPQPGGGSYLMGVNAGSFGMRDIFAFDRAKMLAGQPASFQRFSVARRPNGGLEVLLPSTMQGPTPPPDGEPAVFVRSRDDEQRDEADTPFTDLLELWTLSVDWATPANSRLTQLDSVLVGDFDEELCLSGPPIPVYCMPQPGTSQGLDPIRRVLHAPFPYRNFGDHQSLVGTFPVDVDGTDHVGLRWFELRKTGGSAWTLFQEGLVGGDVGVHRSIGSIAMDGSGNIAMGYTRTGNHAPNYPSIYYRGRLAGDPPGTMPQGEYALQVATESQTGNGRWGDYSGIGIDPTDDCTFWYTSEYGGFRDTRVGAFRFDACGCVSVPPPPVAGVLVPGDNRIDVAWDDSPSATIVSYRVYRATVAGGPYTLLAEVADSSPGVTGGSSYVHHDDTVSGGTIYYYVVKATDGAVCTSSSSNEASALATGSCTAPPTFSGAASVVSSGAPTCALEVGWSPAAANCSQAVTYNVYRSTTNGFTPTLADRIATGLTSVGLTDAVGLTEGATYYYVVRAVDGGTGVEDANTVRKSAVPGGPPEAFGFTESFEGGAFGTGFDQPGWTASPIAGTTSWTWSAARSYDGTHSFFAEGTATVGDRVLVSPPFVVASSTTVSFRHTFQFEGTTGQCFDGGTIESTIDGGATWTVVPASDFVAGGYTGTVNPSTGNPIGGWKGWCAGVFGPLTQVTMLLGGDAGLRNQTVQLRWHAGDNYANASAGWYVDTVIVANAQRAGACGVGTGALTVSNDGPVCEGGTLHLASSWSQPGVTYAWTGPDGFASAIQNPSISSASAAAAGAYVVAVTAGASPMASESTVVSVLADGAACADGNACTLGDACGGGVCVSGATGPPPARATGLVFANSADLSWDPVAGADGYDVVRGNLATLRATGDFGDATDACAASDLAATSFTETHVPAAGDGDWFLVRGISACDHGTFDDGSTSQVVLRDAPIAASANTCP